ncbi:MAG: diguanylate cyclase [Thermodesulfobacteriota bacterium]
MENMQIPIQTDMKKSISGAGSASGLIDIDLWREFQKSLSAMFGISMSLYDGSGNVIAPPCKKNAVCDEILALREGASLCREEYITAAKKAVAEKHTYIFKCHANQYIFAIPVFISSSRAFVIMGGRAYLRGSENEAFYRGVERFSFTSDTLERLKSNMQTVSTLSVFSIPEMVAGLAMPFLKSLYTSGIAMQERPLKPALAAKWEAGGFQDLLDVYKSISSVLDKDELYDMIMSKSMELMSADRGSLMILDKGRRVLTVKASKGMEKRVADNVRIKMGEGISGLTAAKGIPFVVKDIEAEVPWRKNLPGYRTKSFMSVPLKLEERVIGVLNVSDKHTGNDFSNDDLLLLLSFSNFATVALERGAYYSMSEELKTISMTDPLTGLFNRRFFRERLFEEAERVKRRKENFTTFIIDVDNFKAFNDRFGHPAGDEVLRRISMAIKDAVRSMDVVVRYGGEEFAVILPHTAKKDSCVIAERVRADVENLKKSSGLYKDFPTISIGIAEFPRDARNIDDLIYRADAAMYSAKRKGKNRVVVYER